MSKSRWTGGTVRQNLTRKIGHQRIQKISISKFFIFKKFSQNLHTHRGKIYNSAALIPLCSQTLYFRQCQVNVSTLTKSVSELLKKEITTTTLSSKHT